MAEAFGDRLRADLKLAMRRRDNTETRTIRRLLAAIANAEAVSAPPTKPGALAINPGDPVIDSHADMPRRELSKADLDAIVAAEITEHDTVADELDARGQTDRGDELRAERAVLSRYLS